MATTDDLNEIIRMGTAFADALGEESDIDSIEDTAINLMDSDIGVLLIEDHAMAGALVVPNFFDINRLIATELFWWVDEDHRGNGVGKRLLDGLESWARDKGAERLNMIAMDSLDDVGKLYESAGYRKFETSYVRKLWP